LPSNSFICDCSGLSLYRFERNASRIFKLLRTAARAARWRISAIFPIEGRILQSLNLKNPEARRLAAELAALTGESMTAAVIGAMELRLEAERRKKGTTTEQILAFAERFSRELRPGLSSADHADLYDESGIPK
jgi:antitoxin VapB